MGNKVVYATVCEVFRSCSPKMSLATFGTDAQARPARGAKPARDASLSAPADVADFIKKRKAEPKFKNNVLPTQKNTGRDSNPRLKVYGINA